VPISDSPFAVVGATGQQGAAVLDALLQAGEPVRALVRDPDAAAARQIADRGAEVVQADLEDRTSLTAAFRGARAVFLMTTYAGADGPEGEVRRGTTGAEAAADAQVPLVVYSSVGGAERHSDIPHFESKRRIEERLEKLVPTRLVRPTFFMDNLQSQLPSAGDDGDIVVRLPMPGDVPLQMVSVTDIGRVVARVLRQPDLVDAAVEIAGDELTLVAVADRVGVRYGRPARFEPLPIEALGDDADQQAMFRWFVDTPAYTADLEETRRLLPGVLDLTKWLGEVR
jgi:uncharacterized protein YbjT (DUF2867 family)